MSLVDNWVLTMPAGKAQLRCIALFGALSYALASFALDLSTENRGEFAFYAMRLYPPGSLNDPVHKTANDQAAGKSLSSLVNAV